ncbi:hypothetical protein [Citrobacter amalonaticus]
MVDAQPVSGGTLANLYAEGWLITSKKGLKMDIEVLKRSLDRTDALESVVRELISVLTPEQLSAFQTNIKNNWELVEKNAPAELSETISRTKALALKISGIGK